MIEALVGVLFAAFFVGIYFFLSLFRQRTERDKGRLPEPYPPALPGAQAAEAKPRLFKTADELSRHHLQASSSAAAPKMMRAGTNQPGPDAQ